MLLSLSDPHLPYSSIFCSCPWDSREAIPESWLVDYNAALATIGFMMFLGFADDVLDM